MSFPIEIAQNVFESLSEHLVQTAEQLNFRLCVIKQILVRRHTLLYEALPNFRPLICRKAFVEFNPLKVNICSVC